MGDWLLQSMAAGAAGPRGPSVRWAVVPAQFGRGVGRVPAHSLVLAVASASVKTFSSQNAAFRSACMTVGEYVALTSLFGHTTGYQRGQSVQADYASVTSS